MPGFWLATLNPGGRPHRSRRRKARRKSARNAKRFDIAGYMRKLRRKKIRAKLNRKHGSKRRKTVVSRGRPRGRRRLSGRRKVMAKRRKKSRRAPRRRAKRRHSVRRNSWPKEPIRHARASRKGWRRRRKARRNPVLPISWNSWFKEPRRHRWASELGWKRRRRKARRNPSRRRRTRRKVRRNSVIPVSWNPRRGRRGRRRSYRRNPNGVVQALPMLKPMQEFLSIDFWQRTALPAAAGYVGTGAVGKLAWDWIPAGMKPNTGPVLTAMRITTDAVAAGLLSWGAGMFLGREAARSVFVGGVVNVTVSVLKALIGGTAMGEAVGLSGLGQDELSERMKQAVAQRVAAELSGLPMGSFMTAQDLVPQRMGVSGDGMGAFLTDTALRAQPGYNATPEAGTIADYDPLA